MKYEREIIKKLEKEQPHLTYVSGYKNEYTYFKVKCDKGHIFEISPKTIRTSKSKGRYCRCPECYKEKLQKQREKRKQEKQILLRHKEKQKSYKQEIDYLIRELDSLQRKIKKCKQCGKIIIGIKQFCSECKVKKKKDYQRQHKKKTQRETMMKANGKFEAIELQELIKRDNNICYICKQECDSTDSQWVNGAFIVGNNYPSIDHVIPISKGGTNTWDNVRLAHMICNARKGNN